MDPFDDDSSSTNEEIQRLWDKMEGLKSSGALEKEEAAWERQQSVPMPFLETPNPPVAKYQSVDTDRNSQTSHNFTPLTLLQTQSSSSSSSTTPTPLGATTTKKLVATRLLESTQDAKQSKHQDSLDSISSGDSCSDDSSSSSSSLSSSSSSSSSSTSDDDSETSSDESSFSRDRDVDPSSVVMPAKTVPPPKNPYSQNHRGNSPITSKKEHLVSASSSRPKLPSMPRTNHHLEQSHAASNMASPERAGASRTTQVKNPYQSTSKPKSVLQESKMVDLSSQLKTEKRVTSRDHDTSKKEQDDDLFSFFDEDTSSVEVFEKGENSPFFLASKEDQKPKGVKETTQRTTRNTSSMPKQSRTVILEDSDDDSGQDSPLLSVTETQEQDTNQKLNSSTSPDVVIQDYQPETERQPEIDPSLYAPPVYKEKPRPVLHQFTAQNRPIGSRPQIPTSNLFPAPINLLWQSKFEHFNHLQSEVANMVCHSDDNVVVSAPTGAGKTAIFEMGLARFITRDLQSRGPLKGGGTARLSKHRKVVYFAPSKALCEERYQDWSHRLSRLQLGIEVSMITGDVEKGHCYYDLANSHFILTTPEKWDSILRKWSENFFLLASVKLLMIDEVHLIGDPSRGCCLESILARMKTIQRAAQNIKITPSDLYSSKYVQLHRQ
jgi:superfamily II RNA helicase